MLKLRQDLQKNIFTASDKIRFGTHLDRFLKVVAEPTLKPKTVSAYRWLINSHIKPNLGHLNLQELRPDHLQTLYKRKLDEVLSKRTVQHMHAVIRRSLNQAIKWELIYRNPALLVDAPTPDKQPPNTFTRDQARQFLKSVRDHRWYSLYVLAITTGMRRGEILGLTWEAVDFEQGTLSIHHTVQYMEGRIIESEPKTASSRRIISLSPFALNILKNFKNDSGLVFTTSTGNYI